MSQKYNYYARGYVLFNAFGVYSYRVIPVLLELMKGAFRIRVRGRHRRKATWRQRLEMRPI